MAEVGQYRDALPVASGCYLGLRISDLRQLRWEDLLSDEFVIVEQMTGKKRMLRVSTALQKMAKACRKGLGNPPIDSFAFSRERGGEPISRQAVDLMLKKAKIRYRVKSARVFSSHSLRKTFGRRVWLQECDKGRGGTGSASSVRCVWTFIHRYYEAVPRKRSMRFWANFTWLSMMAQKSSPSSGYRAWKRSTISAAWSCLAAKMMDLPSFSPASMR